MIRIMEEERDYYRTEYETLRKKKGAGKSPTNKEKVNNSNLNYLRNVHYFYRSFGAQLKRSPVIQAP